MALTTKKSITIDGQSKINDITVVSMNGKVSTNNGNSNIVTTIVNQELYDANKEECRTDIDAFTAEVRALEDAQIVE